MLKFITSRKICLFIMSFHGVSYLIYKLCLTKFSVIQLVHISTCIQKCFYSSIPGLPAAIVAISLGIAVGKDDIQSFVDDK